MSLDERVACQRAVEEVYWSHRIWPEQNTAPKPPLSTVLPEERLRDKVIDGLRRSEAVGTIWNRPITSAQLQAETERMARNTRDPDLLRDLWDSLGNDPSMVAECLARPILADRLIRNWYAFDGRLHADLRSRAEADLDLHETVEAMRAMSGNYEEQVWRRDGLPGSDAATCEAASVQVLDEGSWLAALAGLWRAFGQEDTHTRASGSGVPVRTLSPLREDEDRFYILAVLDEDPGSLTVATVSWPKVSFEEWWALQGPRISSSLPDETATSAPLPSIASAGCTDDSWTPLPFVPEERKNHVMTWTGAELLVWGGQPFVEGDIVPGGRYDPATDTWWPINEVDAPSARHFATGVWSGTEMIVWGGAGNGTNQVNTGSRYDPVTDSWTPTSTSGNVPSARWRHTAVWTGSEMIVWGGLSAEAGNSGLSTGGRYSLGTDSWEAVNNTGTPAARYLHTAVWTGSRMIVWGGENAGVIFRDGGRYDPSTNTWSSLALTNAPEARSLHTAIWSGEEMIVWGGCRSSACFYPLLDSGGRYRPATNTWRSTSTQGAPYQRQRHSAVWTGSKMIVFGGCTNSDCSNYTNTGGRYDPVADSWTPTNATTPGGRAQHGAVWTGSEMIVWGGCIGGQCDIELLTGDRYNPTTDSWVPTGGTRPPVGRLYETAVWSGAEMIIWGGQAGSATNDGKRYDPTTDRWSSVARLGAPAARERHSAVWTGTEMVVWGGALRTGGAADTGGRYNPASDSWTPTSTAGAPPARHEHTAAWTGREMIVWGGRNNPTFYDSTGGRYDPTTDSWTATSTAGAPVGRFRHTSFWTGDEMIVWGGELVDLSQTNTGGKYSPLADAWTPTSLSGAPGPRDSHAGVWTGEEMIVSGGAGPGGPLDDGAGYDPVSGAWRPLSQLSAPVSRYNHTAVWTGTEMIVWGGENSGTIYRSGGRYTPTADAWTPVSIGAFTISGRTMHTAVWTGSEMIVWGGMADWGRRPETGSLYCASGSKAASPGETSGLMVSKKGDLVDLAWHTSCSPTATDYAIYEGSIGVWSSHMPALCSTGGLTAATISPAAGNSYYLIVPRDASEEGSYGRDSTGHERPAASAACLPVQDLAGCR